MIDEVQAGSEVANEIAQNIIKAAGETLQRYGNDPNSNAILGAGFFLAIKRINEYVDPNFQEFIKRMLVK